MGQTRTANVHELKCSEPYFRDVVNGIKTFEVRRFSTPGHFAVGDKIVLREYNRATQHYVGGTWSGTVTYVLTDREYVKTGHAILGIKPL